MTEEVNIYNTVVQGTCTYIVGVFRVSHDDNKSKMLESVFVFLFAECTANAF